MTSYLSNKFLSFPKLWLLIVGLFLKQFECIILSKDSVLPRAYISKKTYITDSHIWHFNKTLVFLKIEIKIFLKYLIVFGFFLRKHKIRNRT